MTNLLPCPPMFRTALKTLFLFQFIFTGFYGSFLPSTMTGLLYHMSGLLLMIAWILQGFLYRDPWLRALNNPAGAMFLALNFFNALTVFRANTPSLSRDFLEGRFWVLLLLLVAYDLMDDGDFRTGLKKAWLFLVFASACYGIYQVQVGLPELRVTLTDSGQMPAGTLMSDRLSARINSNEIFGTYIYPNVFGALCSLGVISLPLFLPGRSLPAMMLLSSAVGAILYCLWGSQSKGAWLSLILAALISAGICLWTSGRKRICLTLVLLCLAASAAAWKPALAWCGPSTEVRLGYWSSALAMIKENPLGVGIANFSEHYPAHMTGNATEVKMAHNDHLQQLAELGIVGFLIYAAFWICLMKAALAHLTAKEEPVQENSPVFAIAASGVLILLFLLCQVGRLGSMDVNRLGGLLWLAMLLAILAISSLRFAPSSLSQRAVPLAMTLCFFIHSSADFLFYDHSFAALFLVTVLGLSGEKTKALEMPRGSRLVVIVIMVGTLYIFFDRYMTIFPVSKYEQGLSFTEGDAAELMSLCRSVPRELGPWDSLIRNLERNPSLMQNPAFRLLYREALDGALACRPHSASLCLKKTRITAAPNEAEPWYLQAIRAYPRHPRYSFHYAIFLSRSARYAEAREYFERALRLHQEASAKAARQPDFKLLCLQDRELEMLTKYTRFMAL